MHGAYLNLRVNHIHAMHGAYLDLRVNLIHAMNGAYLDLQVNHIHAMQHEQQQPAAFVAICRVLSAPLSGTARLHVRNATAS